MEKSGFITSGYHAFISRETALQGSSGKGNVVLNTVTNSHTGGIHFFIEKVYCFAYGNFKTLDFSLLTVY